jgi:hypothetical protein
MLPPTGDLAVGRPKQILYAAAALSLVAALIHLWVTPEHLEEWWGYGAFFLVSAVAQALYAPLLLRRPDRAILLLGVAGNLAIVSLYLLTRTVGIPFFGPHAGESEEVGFTDLCATTSELGIIVALGAVLLRNLTSEGRRLVLLVSAVALISVGHVVHLLLR